MENQHIVSVHLSALQQHDTFVLLDASEDVGSHKSYLFTDSIDTIELKNNQNAKQVFEVIEQATSSYYVAGFFNYELGYALEPALQHLLPETHQSLLTLGVFKERQVVTLQCDLQEQNVCIEGSSFSIEEHEYKQHVVDIQQALEAGESYQVNFTGQYQFECSAGPLQLYQRLRRNQPTAYSALIRFGEQWILSFSPELFFKIEASSPIPNPSPKGGGGSPSPSGRGARGEGRRITMQPMKGTAKRGRTNAEDAHRMKALQQNPKERAENLMIVDLIRNDIGRICSTGSVEVTDLCAVRKLHTVLQMVSTIEGDLLPNVTWFEIFTALFPCGSVTGAPKIRTMELIATHETRERGVYCGGIGYLGPNKEAALSVPIRTIQMNESQCVMGSGSGITVASNPQNEWEEVQLKAKFLTVEYPTFQLIESMLYKEGALQLLPLHLERLQDSATYFGFVCNLDDIQLKLDQFTASLSHAEQYKVRLLLSSDGFCALSYEALPDMSTLGRVVLADATIDSASRFFFHKTTHRSLYNFVYKQVCAEGYNEALFFNEHQQLTEGCISNVIIEKGGTWLTPALECGVLPGVYRQHLLHEGKVQESILTKDDLFSAGKVYVCNAIRGMWEVRVSE